MHKTITMFRKVKDLNELINFYLQEIFPLLHQLPGILYSDVIPIQPMSPDFPEDLEGIQVMMETYFESQEALVNMVESEEGLAVLQKIEAASFDCVQYVYLGQIKRIEDKSKPKK